MKSVLFYSLMVFIFSCNTKSNKNSDPPDEIEFLSEATEYYNERDYDEAQKYFDQLLLINNSNGEYYYKRAYGKYMQLNDIHGSISDFQNSIRLKYKNTKGAYVGIAINYRIQGEYDSSLYYYNKALEIDPNYVKAKEGRREILYIIHQSN